MTDIKDLSKKLREAREKATSGEWQTWAGWLSWSKASDSFFPDESHWVLASNEVLKKPDWTGSPKKFDDIIGRIHRDQDQASIAFVMNNITRILDELDRLIEVEKVLKRVDEILWFDPSSQEGACMLCDANLHENAMGKHQQLNGEPCPVQMIHDALKRADKIGKGK